MNSEYNWSLRVTMERPSINVIIFDEDEPSSKDHRDSRTVVSSKQAGPSSSHHIEIIEQEIQYLTDKIRTLEHQADSLSQLKNESNANYKHSTTSIDITPAHSKEVVMAIEKKIQIIVR